MTKVNLFDAFYAAYPPLPEGLSYVRDCYLPTREETLLRAAKGPAIANPGYIPPRILELVAALGRDYVAHLPSPDLPRPVGPALRKPEQKAAA